MPLATATSPPAGERPRGTWAGDWTPEPTPPHPRPAATARTVAAGGNPAAADIAREATRFARPADRTSTPGPTAAPGGRRAPAGPGWLALGAGVALAAGTVAVAAVAAMFAAFVFLIAVGGNALRVDHGSAAVWLLAAGFGLAAAAALLALAGSRPPRPATVALAALAPAAAWLSGHPVPALLASLLVTGPAIALDRARPGRRVPASPATALALAATACLAASFAAAEHAPRLPHAAAVAGHSAPRSRTHEAPHRQPNGATAAGTGRSAPRSRPHEPPRDAAGPVELVVAYYAALDEGRFRAAWAVLSNGVRRGFGGFAHWRNGFATTISSRPRRIVATARGRNAWDVRTVLVARDRSGCGDRLTRRFAVRWRIARASGWSVRSLSAVALGPAASPAPCR